MTSNQRAKLIGSPINIPRNNLIAFSPSDRSRIATDGGASKSGACLKVAVSYSEFGSGLIAFEAITPHMARLIGRAAMSNC